MIDPMISMILRDYRIISLLGRGGMGEVFLAQETLLGRQVAIKRLNPQLTGDPQFSKRFINEARIQAQFIHPNIVALHSFFIHEDVFYMAMEYARGLTLKELIAKTGPIQEQRALAIFRQITEALCFAHSKGIVHRDIKPSNIMIDEHDRVKIRDFGIARILSDGHLTRTGSKLGTLYYMSPERVIATNDVDHLSDIYSAGLVLFEMLTGKLPFKTNTNSDFEVMTDIVNRILPDPREFYPNISERTIKMLITLTSKNKAGRPEARELLNELDMISQSFDNSNSYVVKTLAKNQHNANRSPKESLGRVYEKTSMKQVSLEKEQLPNTDSNDTKHVKNGKRSILVSIASIASIILLVAVAYVVYQKSAAERLAKELADQGFILVEGGYMRSDSGNSGYNAIVLGNQANVDTFYS